MAHPEDNASPTSTPLVDVLTAEGRIAVVNAEQATQLGMPAAALENADWSSVYTPESRARIAAEFARAAPLPNIISLEMKTATGVPLQVTAVTERFDSPEHGPSLRLYKWPAVGAMDDVAKLIEENEVLAGIVATSDDASWCIEWTDPVDLSAPEHEIVRQVFENSSHWRFCNAAMARLYGVPPAVDMNARPVAEYFPRTVENEEFIRTLIRANFDVNGTPSRDRRYDGVYIAVENDVRGHIRGNKLFRMWGTVRDVSKHLRRESALRSEIEWLQAMLSALPDAVLVIDQQGSILHTNLAAEALLEGTPETLAVGGLRQILRWDIPLSDLFQQAQDCSSSQPQVPCTVVVRRSDGSAHLAGTARALEMKGIRALLLCLRLDRSGILEIPEKVKSLGRTR